MSVFTKLAREYVDALGRLGVLRDEVERQLERRRIAEKHWHDVESNLVDSVEKGGNPRAYDLGDGRVLIVIGSPYRVQTLPLDKWEQDTCRTVVGQP